MAVHQPSIIVPRTKSWARFCRNGQVPNGSYQHNLASGVNHIVAFRRKLCFSYSLPLTHVEGWSGTQNHWHGYVNTGFGAKTLVFDMLLAGSDNENAADPYVSWFVTPSGDSAVETDRLHYSSVDTNATPPTPQQFFRAQIRYDVVENQAYELRLSVSDYARPISCSIYEEATIPLDDTGAGPADASVGVASPIYDKHQLGVTENATSLWQNNAAHLIAYSRNRDLSNEVVTTTSVNYLNILDPGIDDSVGATSIGYKTYLQYKNSYSFATVPVKLAVRAKSTVGTHAQNKVRIYDGTNSIVASGFGTTASWITTTGTMAATDAVKWDIQAAVNTGDTLRIDAVALYQWEA